MPSLYYEDVEDGRRFETARHQVSATDVEMFARASGDRSAIHFDGEFAARSRFERPIVHGILGVSLFSGLFARLGVFEETSVALLRIDEWEFIAPIHTGDTVYGVATLHQVRVRRDGVTGVVERRCELVNQDGVVVQRGTLHNLIRRRES